MADLGTNPREARERLGLTLEQAAERSGVHATEVSGSRRETGPAGFDTEKAGQGGGAEAGAASRLTQGACRETVRIASTNS